MLASISAPASWVSSVSISCPFLLQSPAWQVNHEYVVFTFTNGGKFKGHHFLSSDMLRTQNPVFFRDFDCLEPLHLSFHELQLARVERRPTHGNLDLKTKPRRNPHWRTELLLGDIHTQLEERARYRPTAWQPYSLLKASKVS